MIESRLVLHFPGFEPLDAEAHRQRYQRSAAQAAKIWESRFDVGPMTADAAGSHFPVDASGAGWATRSEVHIHDHNDLIATLRSGTVTEQIVKGFAAGGAVVMQGGAFAYLRHAWRFGLFFLFPYLFIALGLMLAVALAAAPLSAGKTPLWLLLSIPAGYVFFRYLLIPFSSLYHILHLFADWRLAVAVAQDRPDVAAWIERAAGQVAQALRNPAAEILVTSHSMGASLAISVIGRLLERDPAALLGRRLTFVTLGGAALQCSLLTSATVLRRRIGFLAQHADVDWFDIQCLTDPIHLYKCQTVALSGHPDAPQPKLVFVRFKHSMSAERYERNRRDFLRMHRQYVLGPDRRSGFDFTLMTAGPLPALSFEGLHSDHPPKF